MALGDVTAAEMIEAEGDGVAELGFGGPDGEFESRDELEPGGLGGGGGEVRGNGGVLAPREVRDGTQAIERVARQGRLTPDAWMQGAVGGPLSAQALLDEARAASK